MWPCLFPLLSAVSFLYKLVGRIPWCQALMSGRDSWTGIAVAQLWRSDMKQNALNKNQTPMLYVVVTKKCRLLYDQWFWVSCWKIPLHITICSCKISFDFSWNSHYAHETDIIFVVSVIQFRQNSPDYNCRSPTFQCTGFHHECVWIRRGLVCLSVHLHQKMVIKEEITKEIV